MMDGRKNAFFNESVLFRMKEVRTGRLDEKEGSR